MDLARRWLVMASVQRIKMCELVASQLLVQSWYSNLGLEFCVLIFLFAPSHVFASWAHHSIHRAAETVICYFWSSASHDSHNSHNHFKPVLKPVFRLFLDLFEIKKVAFCHGFSSFLPPAFPWQSVAPRAMAAMAAMALTCRSSPWPWLRVATAGRWLPRAPLEAPAGTAPVLIEAPPVQGDPQVTGNRNWLKLGTSRNILEESWTMEPMELSSISLVFSL